MRRLATAQKDSRSNPLKIARLRLVATEHVSGGRVLPPHGVRDARGRWRRDRCRA